MRPMCSWEMVMRRASTSNRTTAEPCSGIAKLPMLLEMRQRATTSRCSMPEAWECNKTARKSFTGCNGVLISAILPLPTIWGRAYERGSAVPLDLQKAIELYQNAALHNNAKAMFALGNLYNEGKGVTQDRQQALMWFIL